MSKFLILTLILSACLVSAEILPLNYNFDNLINSINAASNPKITIAPLVIKKVPGPVIGTNPPVKVDDCPCSNSNYCGNARPFKSQAELKKFTDANCQPLYFSVLPLELKTTAQASTDFSGTNNQQANVDQADIFKTDGQYIYTVSGNVLSIVKAYPYIQTKTVSTISFTAYPQAIFIEGNYLTVFGTDYENTDYSYYGGGVDATLVKRPYFYFRPPYTWVYVYDICNKSKPKLVKDYKIQGYYFNGRKTENGFVYLLSSLNCNGRSSPSPWYNFGQGRKTLPAEKIFYYPGNDYQGANFINIFTFNLRNPLSCEQNLISVLTLNTYIIYMSQKFIYLTSTTYLADKQTTQIHKIYVFKSKIIPTSDGSVDGTINNQFSLDQYNGTTLRVATTETGISGQPSNSVFVLNQNLNVVGSLRNIAPGQRIYSARYVDTRLYLVTFRQIDPFFVIDLSVNTQPTILGELKISGYSNYLHPYDNNTIIGFGRDTNQQGQRLGLKVSLFDVSDVTNPQSLADFVLQQQYAYSTAEWEHKAFLFSKQKNLMVIPGSYYDWQNPELSNANSYNGALVFYINRGTNGATIQLRGIINHILNKSDNDNFWDRSVERSLYIQQLLYTKSRCLLRVNTLSQLNSVVNLPLNCDYEPVVDPKPVADPIFPVIQTISPDPSGVPPII